MENGVEVLIGRSIGNVLVEEMAWMMGFRIVLLVVIFTFGYDL